jgi:hypothetical protein
MPKKAANKAESIATGKTRKRAVSKLAAPSVSETPAARALSHEEIAQHAYGLYMARGASESGEINDWLQAEHELRARVG